LFINTYILLITHQIPKSKCNGELFREARNSFADVIHPLIVHFLP